MNDIEKDVAEEASCQYTNSTALAAALATLGFALKKTKALVRVFTKKNPQRLPDGRPGLGVFHFRLEPNSSAFHIKDSAGLRRQWFAPTADKELDDLIRIIAERASSGVLAAAANGESAKPALEEVQQRFVRLMEILPAAILCYIRQAEENRLILKRSMITACRSSADSPTKRYYKPGQDGWIDLPADLTAAEVRAILEKFA